MVTTAPALSIDVAGHDDIPALLDMSERFFEAAKLDRFGPFDRGAMGIVLGQCVRDSDKEVFIARRDGKIVGLLCMVLVPFFLAPSCVFAQNLCWWVEPEARGNGLGGKLTKAGEDWGRAHGAKYFSMAAMSDDIGARHERAGLRPMQSLWSKEIQCHS